MDNINIGIAKSIIASKLRDDFLSSHTINESKNITSHFYFLLEGSEYLRGQYDMINNIENKKISNDVLAKNYIDDNLSSLGKYSYSQISESNKKLKPFIKNEDLSQIDENKKKLYNAITTLIEENAKRKTYEADANLIHESYETIMEHMKMNSEVEKEIVNEEVSDINIDMDMVLPIAMAKFNSKFSNLDENERKIVNKLAIGSFEDKKEMFESLKNENLKLLSNIKDDNIDDKISETVEKVSNMKYTDNTSIKDVIKLYDLKSNLS